MSWNLVKAVLFVIISILDAYDAYTNRNPLNLAFAILWAFAGGLFVALEVGA